MKEAPMYKTIVLSLLQMRPKLYDKLRHRRILMQTLDHYSALLKANHEAWKDRLSQAKPGTGETELATEALELALQEFRDSLNSGLPLNESEPLSLDGAIAFIRARTPPK
jgi:hypothetical protein